MQVGISVFNTEQAVETEAVKSLNHAINNRYFGIKQTSFLFLIFTSPCVAVRLWQIKRWYSNKMLFNGSQESVKSIQIFRKHNKRTIINIQNIK